MIVLDTNVLSELMRAAPSGEVMRWVAGQPASSLYTTSISQAEILHGILLLDPGKRRSAIEAAAEAVFDKDFGGRILAFGSEAAHAYARITTTRRRLGTPISHFDAQIAAIVHAAGAALATRNAKYFANCGIEILDPWAA